MLVIVVAIVAILLDMIAFVVVFVGVARTQRLLFGGVFRLFAQQRVPVFLRDLIIIGVDFRKGEEAVAVAAIIDERRLQRRFNPRHLGEEIGGASCRERVWAYEILQGSAVSLKKTTDKQENT